MKNFFEAICLADMEKMHSAMIAWMLSDSCTVFSKTGKSHILCDLFGEKRRGFDEIDTYTEWKSIDVIIFTKDKQGTWECWMLENKVKTSQHSNQLKKYESDEINYCGRIFKWPADRMHFCLLSLIPEKPQGNAPWKNSLYSLLKDILNCISFKANNAPDEIVFVESYKKCVNNLCTHLDRFMTSVLNGKGLDYKYVFENGGKMKNKKLPALRQNKSASHEEMFITGNSLETIFQKCYLTYLGQQLIRKTKNIDFFVTESRGNAHLCINSNNWVMDRRKIDHYKKYNKNSNVKKDPMNLEFSLSFQNGTLGIVFTGDYDNRGVYSAEDTELIYHSNDDYFSEGSLEQNLKLFGNNISPSTKKDKPRWAKTDKIDNWYINKPDDIITRLQDACSTLDDLVNKLYSQFKK